MTTKTIPSYSKDLFTDELLLDPSAYLDEMRELRALGPVVWLEAHNAYILPRYEQVRAALLDETTFRSGAGVGLNDAANESGEGVSISTDGEPHAVARAVTIRPLTPRALNAIKDGVQATADEIVTSVVAQGSFDGVVDLARVLPLKVVPDLLGWPDDARESLLRWAAAAFDFLGPWNKRAEEAGPAVFEGFECAAEVARTRNLAPDSFGSQVLEAADRGEITAEQVPLALLDYLFPSMDTTISAVSNMLWLFATHTDQWEAVRSDPTLIPFAFQEVLRLDAPIRLFTRATTTDVSIEDHVIPEGARVVLHYGSANRDERQFPDPDRFDVQRKNSSAHLAFGAGVHACLGQALARVEGHALLASLVRQVQTIKLNGEPRKSLSNLINGWEELPISVTPVETATPS